MIVIRVELWSAVTGAKTELARMAISNDGSSGGQRRNYEGEAFTGRSLAALDRAMVKGTVTRRGKVENHDAPGLHVWNLVAKMLRSMGYGE